MQALGQKILASSIYSPNAEPVFPTYEGFEGFVTPSPGIPTPTPSSTYRQKMTIRRSTMTNLKVRTSPRRVETRETPQMRRLLWLTMKKSVRPVEGDGHDSIPRKLVVVMMMREG